MTEIPVKTLVFNHEKFFIPEAAAGVNADIQYRLTGEEAGDYIVHISDGQCKVQEGVIEQPTVTLSADGRDFADVLLGKANGMQYFMLGKLKLAGDLNLAMKLTQFFRMSGQ
jgi:putative sterol carrier protein